MILNILKKIHLTKLVFATNELKNQIPYFCIIYFAYSRASVVDPWINKWCSKCEKYISNLIFLNIQVSFYEIKFSFAK
jgi:hypothetical protein